MALFVLSLCPFDISVGVGAFVIGLSQISSFFSICIDHVHILLHMAIFVGTIQTSFCPITFKLYMHIVADERRNLIDFGSRGQMSRSKSALCV